jgi:hypothetical protein
LAKRQQQPPAQPVAPPAATVATPVTAPAETKNISSDEIESEEVHKIADELKQQLGKPTTLPTDKPEDHDTIVIDHEGMFKQAEENKKKAS